MGKYKAFVDLLSQLENANYGEWHSEEGQFSFPIYSEVVNSLIREVYAFNDNNPEFELNHYSDLLEQRGMKWSMDSLIKADATNMDEQGIMAMLMGLVRAERFCDGAVLRGLESGAVQKWLTRLKELNDMN